MKIPKTLKIGGHTIKVVEAEDLPNNVDAEFSTVTGTIRIDKGLNQTNKEEALLHEILHGLNAEFHEGLGHMFMASLSQQLYQVIHDNKLRF